LVSYKPNYKLLFNLYNVKNQSHINKIIDYVTNINLTVLEALELKLEIILVRSGLFNNLSDVIKAIKNGQILVNGKKCYKGNNIIFPGSKIQVLN
jgi:ribosomal protein S4|tara:strand:- start:2211 stop:2495 length:285 start_codon:yes stop_codon:yes gene_type:complete